MTEPIKGIDNVTEGILAGVAIFAGLVVCAKILDGFETHRRHNADHKSTDKLYHGHRALDHIVHESYISDPDLGTDFQAASRGV